MTPRPALTALLAPLVALTLLALAPQPARGAVIGFVQTPEGRIDLHDEQGSVCAGRALRAEFVAHDGTRIGGCWTASGVVAHVVFFDGDIAQVPLQALSKPQGA